MNSVASLIDLDRGPSTIEDFNVRKNGRHHVSRANQGAKFATDRHPIPILPRESHSEQPKEKPACPISLLDRLSALAAICTIILIFISCRKPDCAQYRIECHRSFLHI
jgi:hypothetical protein